MLADRDPPASAPKKPNPRNTGKPNGRPSSYTPAIGQAICDAYSSSALSLPQILRSAPHFPDWSTLYRWEDAHEEFRQALARARERHADYLVSECSGIADTQELGEKVKTWKGEREVTTADMIEHRKLRIDTRFRLAKFLNPAKYGDKVEVGGTVTLEALILASMKLDEKPVRAPPAAPIEGHARARLAGPDGDSEPL